MFKWTPTVSGVATLQTCGAGTGFDTVLYVWTGSCSAGTEVACNDDTTSSGTGDACAPNNQFHGSMVQLAVTAGQTYYVFLDVCRLVRRLERPLQPDSDAARPLTT